MMTGYRAFSYQFVKSFPVLSKGFEIETEMTIHAIDKNMLVTNEVIAYREAHVLLRIISLIFIFLHNNLVKSPWQASALPRALCLVLVRKILKMRCNAVQIV